MPEGNTFTGTCTCGSCRQALRDEYGNQDYGYRWSDTRNDYVARPCEVADYRREFASR